MKLKALYLMIAFLLGSIFKQILYHFRFNNDLLRREMLIFMREGNSGYFLGMIIIDFFIVFFLIIGVFIIKTKNRRIKMEKEKKGIIKSVVEDDEDYTKFVTRAIKISSKVEESICKFLNNIRKIFIKTNEKK